MHGSWGLHLGGGEVLRDDGDPAPTGDFGGDRLDKRSQIERAQVLLDLEAFAESITTEITSRGRVTVVSEHFAAAESATASRGT